MATYNGITVNKRYNRPDILTPTMLEMFFTNNGTYFDPETVSAVYILPDTGLTNGSPDIYINRTVSDIGTNQYGLIATSSLSSVVAYFDVSNTLDTPGNAADPGEYPGSFNTIFKNDNGQYCVLVDGTNFPTFSSLGISDGNWFDIWLVEDFANSGKFKLYWNKFTTYNSRILTFTEPYQVSCKNKLQQKYIQLSSIETLRVTTEMFLDNKSMSRDAQNVFNELSIFNTQIRIRKRNPQTTGQITTVVNWTGTGVDVTSDNTILYSWNTSSQERGDYTVQVRYNILEQLIYSEEFSLVLR